MSDITLQWFFQIPGLFITIGVLLILIALLVLVIGSTKAKKKQQEDLSLVDDEKEAVVNQVDSVNVAMDDVSVNHLGGINNLDGANNFSPLSNVNNLETNNVAPVEPVRVTPVSIINDKEPVADATSSAFSPLNLNESVEKPVENVSEQSTNTLNNSTLVEQTPVEPIVPVQAPQLQQEPVASASTGVEINSVPTINPVPVTPIANVTLNETNNPINDNNLIPQPTMVSVFSEPVIQSVDNSNTDVVNNNNNNIVTDNVVPTIQPVAPVDNSLVSDMIIQPIDTLDVVDVNNDQELNNVQTPQVEANVEPIATPVQVSNSSTMSNEIIEPVKSIPDMNNVQFVAPTIPNVNTAPVVNQVNNEVEEIL